MARALVAFAAPLTFFVSAPTRPNTGRGRNSVAFGYLRLPFWPAVLTAIAITKGALLTVDSLPMFFLGDSASYIQTSLTGWIPPDRSFLYGYFIRATTSWSANLASLIFAQVLLSALSAALVAYVCFNLIELPGWPSLLATMFVTLDPLQLLYERFVLTETLSLSVYVVFVLLCLTYLRRRRAALLPLIAFTAVLSIALRLSFLIVVTSGAVTLALMPLVREQDKSFGRRRWIRALRDGATAVVLILLFENGYKRLNGYLVGRPPAFQYEDGLFLVSAWAPILQPEDTSDHRISAVIAQGDEYGLRDLSIRNTQHYSPGHLVARLAPVVAGDLNETCKRLAISAAFHHPFALAILASQTLSSFFDATDRTESMRRDRGEDRPLPPDLRDVLASRFHLASDNLNIIPTVTKSYHRAASYYYPLLLLTPLVGILAVYRCRERRDYALFLMIQSGLIVGTIAILSPGAVVRYLHPLPPLLAISVAVLFSSGRARTGAARIDTPAPTDVVATSA